MKFMTMLACALCTVATIAEENGRNAAEMREAVLRKTGGFVVAPASGRGILLVDADSGVPEGAFDKFMKAVSTGPRFSVTMKKGEPNEKYMPDQ